MSLPCNLQVDEGGGGNWIHDLPSGKWGPVHQTKALLASLHRFLRVFFGSHDLSRPIYPTSVVSWGGPWIICGINEPKLQLGWPIWGITYIVTDDIRADSSPLPCEYVDIRIVFVRLTRSRNCLWRLAKRRNCLCDPSMTKTTGH